MKIMTKYSEKNQMTKIPIAIDTETTNKNPHKANLLGVSYYSEGKSSFEKFPSGFGLVQDRFFVVTQNGKYDAVVLKKYGCYLSIHADTMIMQYLLHIDKSQKLENMVKQYFDVYKEDLQEMYNRVTTENRKTLPDKWWERIPKQELEKYAKSDVEWTYKLYEHLSSELEDQPLLKNWFYNVEMPLLNILTKVELKGVKIDIVRLKELESCLLIESNRIEKRLKLLAGKEINYNSPKQLQEYLFKDLKLKSLKKTRTGQKATDHKTLEILSEQHAVPKLILRYREIDKLLSTYCKPIREGVDNQQRLHCTYNQALTVTRRFSSENPNLQNIPNKSDLGLKVQECFVPEEGHKFLICDYDQVELRLLAHFSKDKNLINAFKNEVSVHQATADFISKKLNRDFDKAKGKLLNFSLLYGKTAYGFAQDWNCSKEEAEEIIETWFALYPDVKKYIEEQQYEISKNNGWTNTLAGLPLYCGDPLTNNRGEYEHYLRCCVNYRIQGSSQDILKKAIVNIYEELDLFPVLMVHDSLIYELDPKNQEEAESYLNDIPLCMESVWQLEVPVKVSYKITDKWVK